MSNQPQTATQSQFGFLPSQAPNPKPLKKWHNTADTSRDAWHGKAKHAQAGQQRDILRLLHEAIDGLTRKELASKLDTVASSLTAAVNGLRESGRIVQSNQRRDGGHVLFISRQRGLQHVSTPIATVIESRGLEEVK